MKKRERVSFSTVKNVIEPPNLIEIQTKPYKEFIEEGLMEIFKDISPIKDHNEELLLEFVDCEVAEEAKIGIEECKERDANYAVPIKLLLRFINKTNGEVKEQTVFMGDFPKMTEKGTFIINGAERVVVSQLVRSPGVYFSSGVDKSGAELFASTIIPGRGSYLEFETDSNEILYTRIDRQRKMPLTILLRALGYETKEQIIETFGEDDRLLKTLEKDSTKTQKEALLEIYKKLRPGEPLAVKSAASLISSLYFEERRYDLAKVGRYKYSKKLELKNRITGLVAASDVISPFGELLARRGEEITPDIAEEINDSGVQEVEVYGPQGEVVKVLGNRFVNLSKYIDPAGMKIAERVYFPVLKSILDEYEDMDDVWENAEAIRDRILKGNYARAIHRWKDSLYEKESKIQLEVKPKNGELKIDGYKMEYTPKRGFLGSDYILYKYEEDSKKIREEKIEARRVIKVVGDIRNTNVNTALKLEAYEALADEDVIAIKFTKKPKNGNLAVDGKIIEKYPSKVDVDGCTLTYIPDPHFIGSDKAECVVCFKNGSESAEVYEIDVNGDYFNTAINTDVLIDRYGDLASIAKDPAHGEAKRSMNSILYKPAKDFEGIDSFEVEYVDENGLKSTKSVVVRVAGSSLKTYVNEQAVYQVKKADELKIVIKPKQGKVKATEEGLLYTPQACTPTCRP